ncbi:MAG: hypothetical protein A2X05_15370 [Bacteroidetes bacterium GWE2_41_25]|nr:MAG: hypothetical protein A2X03_16555 [Bacteroidetes bacterium GWA2_40_15]OFX97712.1 MAG: hypothetical protein A2X06_13245 [Bacteroidetes bacterium GWC2_40_22]OFY13049.1 MAG: hypothetical protein A2X05_15370 [Bacteroidetes bacterium GWE2_41_25]OFY58401.1 MAG: hypothetical protein A2X04_06660 [Bacteroidetes bacterium GWF2_41_9]HAM11419.1 hypothetical protein [Bacteroidales bacterium]
MRRSIFILASLIIISCSPLRQYQYLPEVKAWETEIQKFEQLDNKERYPAESVMFAGSSSIRLWSALKEDMAPYPVIQRGYGGAKLSDFAVYADRIFDPHKCSAIAIFIANDIVGSEKDKSPEEVLTLYKSVIKTIRKNQPETPVFWIAITPTSSRWKVWPEIQKANNLIKEYCDNSKNLYFIKTDLAFLDEDGKPINEFFRDDLLHLNADGYAVWKKIIKDELDRVLKHN